MALTQAKTSHFFVARCGYADFWEMYKRSLLPQETNYALNPGVPIISKNRSATASTQDDPTLSYDIWVPSQTDLKVIAELLGAL